VLTFDNIASQKSGIKLLTNYYQPIATKCNGKISHPLHTNFIYCFEYQIFIMFLHWQNYKIHNRKIQLIFSNFENHKRILHCFKSFFDPIWLSKQWNLSKFNGICKQDNHSQCILNRFDAVIYNIKCNF